MIDRTLERQRRRLGRGCASRSRSWRGLAAFAFAFAAIGVFGWAAPASVRADEIQLKLGSKINGVILPDSPDLDYVFAQTARSKTPMKLRKTDVVSVTPKKDELSEYLSRRQAAAKDAESQFNLGLWCEANKLPGPAHYHFEQTIVSDPDHEGGRDKLGHVSRDGQWLTGDEAREALGWVKVKGKWLSPEEKSKLDDRHKLLADQELWLRRLQVFVRQWKLGDPQKSVEAQEQILAVSSPSAVAPFLKLLGVERNVQLRMILTKGLAGISGSEANASLIDRALIEPDDSVRQAVSEALRDRKAPETALRLTRVLASKNQMIRGRAAQALAVIGDRRSVPQLIEALVQIERRTIFQDEVVNGRGGGGMPFNISAVQPGGASGTNSPLPQVTTGVGIQPVVAPGVAVQVPYPVGIGTGISQAPRTVPTMRTAQFTINHPEVLAALESLTGQNFGFNIPVWKDWARKSFKSTPFLPSRYVPQP